MKVLPSEYNSNNKSGSNIVFFNLLNNSEFLKGLFVFCLVAILLFIFEFVLFYVVIVPLETSQLIDLLSSNSSGFGALFNGGSSNVALEVLNQRETALDATINMYYIYIMIAIVCILIVGFIFSIYKLHTLKSSETILYGPSIINTIITIIIILAFQIQVYYFGRQFKYPSSEEMLGLFSQTISNNLGPETIAPVTAGPTLNNTNITIPPLSQTHVFS